MSDESVTGPIDYLLLEFPADADTQAAAAAIEDLVVRDIVRILDIMVIRKQVDGAVSVVDLSEIAADGRVGFLVFAGASSGLLGDDDLTEAAAVLEPGTAAALLIYENTWARGFVRAARDAGGQVVATARIPAEDVMAALDALEAG